MNEEFFLKINGEEDDSAVPEEGQPEGEESPEAFTDDGNDGLEEDDETGTEV